MKPKLGSGERFKKVSKSIEGKLKGANKAKRARAIAASVGRKKYGAKKMAKMAAAGRRRKS